MNKKIIKLATLITGILLAVPVDGVSQFAGLNSEDLSRHVTSLRDSIDKYPDRVLQLNNVMDENTNYLIAEGNGDILEIVQQGKQATLTLYAQKGEPKWSNTIEIKGFGVFAEISENSNRIIAHGYGDHEVSVEAVYDSTGTMIAGPIRGMLNMSPTGNYFVPSDRQVNRSLILYDKNAAETSTEFIASLLNIDQENYTYSFSYDFFEKDILKLGFNEYEIDPEDVLKRGQKRRNSTYLIDLNSRNIIYTSENSKVFQEFAYQNGKIFYAFNALRADGSYRRGSVQFELLDLATNEVTNFGGGPYAQVEASKKENLFYITRWTKGDYVLHVIDGEDLQLETIVLEDVRWIKNIYRADSGYVIQSSDDSYKHLERVEKLDTDGELTFKYLGWFNDAMHGLIPVESDKVFYKRNF